MTQTSEGVQSVPSGWELVRDYSSFSQNLQWYYSENCIPAESSIQIQVDNPNLLQGGFRLSLYYDTYERKYYQIQPIY